MRTQQEPGGQRGGPPLAASACRPLAPHLPPAMPAPGCPPACLVHPNSRLQVKGLRPGRTYAARVLVNPKVTNFAGEVVVTPCAPSETILVATMPCPPMGQPAPQLASRGKKELKVRRRGLAGRAGAGRL